MSDILLDWLKKDVNIKLKSNNIEENFSNGFLFATILNKYKLITNYHEYTDSQEEAYRNFKLLEKAFRDLEIRCEKGRMDDIMNKKRNVASQYLYQIKMKIARKEINFENLFLQKSLDLHRTFVRGNSSSYDNRMRKTESRKIENKFILPPIDTGNKFDKFKSIQENKIVEEIQKEEEYFTVEKSNNNKKIYEAEKNTHVKKLEKDLIVKQNWEKSMQRKNDWEKKQDFISHSEANFFKNSVMSQFQKSAEENKRQIDLFEKNLSRLGLDVVSIDPKLKRAQAHLSSEMILQKIRDKVSQNDAARKEKERRNRKIQVEQSKAQNEILKSSLLVKSKSDIEEKEKLIQSVLNKRIEYEKWRTLHEIQTKNEEKNERNRMMVSNMNLRDEDYLTSRVFDEEAFFNNLDHQNYKARVMNLEKKKQKRVKHYALCNNIFDMIYDLVEHTYMYQQNTGEDMVDLEKWREWSKMFINNERFEKHVTKDYFDDIHNENEKEVFTEKEIIFSDNELFDYINYMGQWSCNMFSQNIILKIQDIMNPENIGYHNENPYPDYYEPSNDELDILTIPKDNVKTYALGDIIDIILDIKYDNKNNNMVNTNIISHIPIKISLIGHMFAGKKTQSKIISENYPMKIYIIEDLLKNALEILERLEAPIESHPKFKTLKKNQIDQLVHEKAQEEIKYAEIKKIAIQLRDDKDNNELIVDLLLEYIKQDFTEKQQSQVIEEILHKHKRKKEINEELTKIKEEQAKKAKNKAKEEQQLISELNKINVDSNKGFIVVDFPRNIEQAKILEKRLTNYIQEIEKPITASVYYKEKFSMILDRPLAKSNKKSIKNSGLDILLVIDTNHNECIRRASGRKIDPSTGHIYHIHDNPPPENDKKLNERLQVLDAPLNIDEYNKNFDIQLNDMERFYDSFGNIKYSIKFLNMINGELNKNEVGNEINDYLHKLIKINEDKENEILAKESKDKEFSPYNTQTNLKDSMYNVLNEIDNDDDEMRNYEKYSRKIDEAKKKLSNSSIEKLYNKWNLQYTQYIENCRSVFVNLSKQKEMIITNLNRVQTKYVEFLQRPSKKLNEVMKFQTKYNQFSDEYPDLVSDLDVKEQFFQDIDDLSERIWDQIEVRKNESIEERKKIMSSGFIEKCMEDLFLLYEKLISSEVEKFFSSMTILMEYYYQLDGRTLPEISLSSIISLLKNYDSIQLESNGKFPRIEKLFKNCIKVLFKYEESFKNSDNKNKQTNVIDTSTHSITKRAKPFSKKIHPQTETTILEEKNFQFEEEMKNALKNEKMKFKYKIIQIKFWAENNMTSMRNLANSIYNRLDEWIIITIKNENYSMNYIISKLRDYVEKENKVRYIDVEFDNFNIYEKIEVSLSSEFLAYDIEEDRFNYNSFIQIYDEVRLTEIQKNYIRTRSFIDIYIKKFITEIGTDGISFGVSRLSFHNFRKFLNFFEFYSNTNQEENNQIEIYKNEMVNHKHVFNILAVIHCKIITNSQEDDIMRSINSHLINNTNIHKNNFLNINFPFIDNPYTPRENVHSLSLVELLFEINKDENDNINILELMNILTLRVVKIESDITNKTYFEVLFI